MEFEGNLSAKDISADIDNISASQKGVYLLYIPPFNFHIAMKPTTAYFVDFFVFSAAVFATSLLM